MVRCLWLRQGQCVPAISCVYVCDRGGCMTRALGERRVRRWEMRGGFGDGVRGTRITDVLLSAVSPPCSP